MSNFFVRSQSRPFHLALLLLAAASIVACSGDAPTSPQLADDLSSAAGASVPGTDLPGDDGDSATTDRDGDVFAGEFGEFGPADIDLSDLEYDGEDGPFEHVMRVANGLELVFRFNGRMRAREEISIKLRIPGGGVAVRGKVTVDFGDGRRVKDFPIDRTAALSHTYAEPGRYRIAVVLQSKDERKAKGGFRLVVNEKMYVSLDADPVDQIRPGEESMISVQATTRLKKNRARGHLTIEWGDGSSDVVEQFEGEALLPHLYKNEGDYTVNMVLIVNEREFTDSTVLSVSDLGADDFDLRQATIMGNSAGDVASWTITSQITGVSISPNQICQFHTKAGRWPIYNDAVEGNPWIVANIGGRWYAGTYEWVRPGQECKGITAGNIGPHIKFPPMSSWRPRAGEVVYVFMSTVSRLGARSTNERSNVVRVVWPY